VLVRGRFAALDVVTAALWAAGLVAAHGALGDLLAASSELERARGAVAGACLGAIVALTVTLVAPPVRGGSRDPALP
jgi:membrane protein DedA with SNARE-associated domain